MTDTTTGKDENNNYATMSPAIIIITLSLSLSLTCGRQTTSARSSLLCNAMSPTIVHSTNRQLNNL